VNQRTGQLEENLGCGLSGKQKTRKLLCDLCGFTTTYNNNQHKTYTHHQQLSPSLQPPTTTATTTTTATNNQAHQASKSTTPTTPSRSSLAPASLPCAPAPGCVLWLPLATISQHSQHSDSQRSPQPQRNVSHHGHLTNSHHGSPCQRIQPARR
jgi:hypothetical protein